MKELLIHPEFWKAISGLISALAWPMAIIIIFALLRKKIFELITDRKELTIKVAGMEINVADATKKAGQELVELQKKVAELEARVATHDRFAEKTNATSENLDDSFNKNTEKKNDVEKSDIFQPENYSILWVDDYPSNNAFLIEYFRTRGLAVDLSLTTGDAIRRLEAHKYSVVITDLGRQEDGADRPMAGLDLIQRIRGHGDTVPILVFAGTRGVEKKKILLSAGASDVTNSPVDVQQFVMRYISGL